MSATMSHASTVGSTQITDLLAALEALEVRFTRPRNLLRFPGETLDAVPPAASPLIASRIEKLAESLLSESESAQLEERGANVVRRLLSSGVIADRSAVARQMHLSVRTLQRQLERESLKFKDVRETVRVELAQLLLSNPTLGVKTGAETLGFAGTAAFSKAFTRWRCLTPTSYRQQGPPNLYPVKLRAT